MCIRDRCNTVEELVRSSEIICTATPSEKAVLPNDKELLSGKSVSYTHLINVVQGERQFARDNKSLGQFRLDGIAPAPREMCIRDRNRCE